MDKKTKKATPSLAEKIFFHAALAGIGGTLLAAGAVFCTTLAIGRLGDGRLFLGILSGCCIGSAFALYRAKRAAKGLIAPFAALEPALRAENAGGDASGNASPNTLGDTPVDTSGDASVDAAQRDGAVEAPEAPYRELAGLTGHIRARNEKLTRQMQDLRAEHEKQDAMRRDFTANVSHELKTPLTSISGYAEIILSGIARPEDIPRFAGKIYDESRRLITLVGDIIRLSRLDGEELPAEEGGPVELHGICEDVLSLLEMAAGKRGIALSLSGPKGYVRGGGQLIEEIVFNLTDNAVKYNRDGGEVRLTLAEQPEGIELAVEDTGIGIPPEDLDRVFERFYRVDKSHSREIGGTGLGLSIVKHGALRLGAKLSLHSRVGEGTVVRVVFPPG